MRLQIAKDLSLPLEAGRWTFADLAIKSAGKTYAAGVMAEEMIKAGIPIVVLDGIGVWWGLRVGAGHGGPRGGLPVLIIGGQHRDVAVPTKFEKGRDLLDEPRLREMVKAILDTGVSVVLDTSEFSKSMQRRAVASFVNELYHLNQDYGVRHVFIEEADMWVPQRIVGDVAVSAGAIDDLVRRGGNFNLGCTLISQRPAVVNKDVLTQINCLIVLRILAKIDKEAVKTWVENAAGKDQPKVQKWYESLGYLKDGEAWVWNPQADIFKRIQFRKKETLHATREFFLTAKVNQSNVRLMDIAEVIDTFREKFEAKGPPMAKPQPYPLKVEPKTLRSLKPVFEEKARDTTPLSASKHTSANDPHGEPGSTADLRSSTDLGSENIQAGEGPRSIREVSELPEPVKTVSTLGNFSINITRLTSTSLEAIVVFILTKTNRWTKFSEVMNMGLEYGWNNPKSSWNSVMSRLVSDGLLVNDGHGAYRVAKNIEVNVERAA